MEMLVILKSNWHYHHVHILVVPILVDCVHVTVNTAVVVTKAANQVVMGCFLQRLNERRKRKAVEKMTMT